MPPLEQLRTIHRSRGRHRLRLRRPWYRAWTALGILLVAGVVVWQVNATLWTTHSNRVGHALVHHFLENRALSAPPTTGTPSSAAPASASLAACHAPDTGDPVKGVLAISKLHVTAPVEQGVGDEQLNVAVGHDPYSVWPGSTGNAVLEAHDVSYFVGIPSLQAGDVVTYTTPCTVYDFRVTSHAIVQQGSPVYDTPTPTLTLVTCYPTDALWFTPDRYLVTAAEVGSSGTSGSATFVPAAPAPSVPVPAELVSQGVTLATYSVPMGTMSLAGTPDVAWSQTTNPLLVESSAVEAFIAGVKALTESRADWWHAIAPGVSEPAPLVGAHNPKYLTALNVIITATGAEATQVALHTTMSVTGGNAPGRYSVAVSETIRQGTLVVSGWAMTPA